MRTHRPTCTHASAALLLLLLAAAGCKTTLSPKPPSLPTTPEPVVEASYAHMPVVVSLDKVRTAADEVLPPVIEAAPFNHNEGGGPDAPACGWNAGYRVERDPISMIGQGNTVTTTLRVRYRLKARARVPCPGPLITGSCGFGGEWPRTASVSMTTSLGVQPDWSSVVNTSVGKPRPGKDKECKILGWGIFDVTQLVMEFFGDKLGEMTGRLDKEAQESLALRSRVESLWTQLREPIDLGQGAWLTIAPEEIALEPIAVSASEIRTGVRLRARPRVVLGAQPEPSPQPLPDAGTVESGNSFNVLLPVQIAHAVLRDQLKKALRIDQGGNLFPPTGDRQVQIIDADVYGYRHQAVVWLKFKGSAKGEMYLTGTPTYNAATNGLSFPDLDYDIKTKNLILELMDWFKHDEFRDYLRGRARLDLATQVSTARNRLFGALNKQYGDVQLSGTVDNLALLGFYGKPEESSFVVYLQTNGTLGLTVP